jgi:hypothetical protein
MELKIKIDTNNSDDFLEAIQILTDAYNSLFEAADEEGDTPDLPEAIKTAVDESITFVQPHQDDFEEAADSDNGFDNIDAISVELDADNMPYDGRIHASTKTKTKAGIWKIKKGVDKDLVKKIQDEYKQAMVAPAESAVTLEDCFKNIPAAESKTDAATAFAAPPVEVPAPPVEVPAPPVEVPAPPVEVPAPPVAISFPAVLMFCTEKFATDKSDQFKIELDKLLAKRQLTSVNQLMARVDLIPNFYAELQETWNKMNTQG